MKKFIFVSSLIVALCVLSGCNQQSTIQPSGNSIKIGVIGPFSGRHLGRGKSGMEGVITAQLLQPLLKNGDKIELITEDDQNDPEKTVEALKKLAEQDQVKAILTFSDSQAVLELTAIADTYKIPIIALLATNPNITKNNHFISQLCFDDTVQGAVAALYVADELLIENVAVFIDNDNPYSIFLGTYFSDKFKSLGGHITATLPIIKGGGNYTDKLKALQKKGTELLYLPLEADHSLNIVWSAKQIGWDVKIMGSDGLLASILTEHEDTNLLEGLLAIDFYSLKMPLSPYGKKIHKKIKELFDDTPTTYSALGAEGYSFILNAMNRCPQPTDTFCINQKIRSTENFTGMIGKISIGNNGKAQRPLVVNKIHSGELDFVVKVY